LVSSLLGTVGQNQNIRFNNDSASNYSNTYLEGDGSSAFSGRRSNQTSLIDFGVIRTTANTFSTNILQIQNYSNTTTYKTALTRNGLASTALQAVVGLWRSTSAINRIDLSPGSGNFEVGSTFSLYGIANADQGAAKATGGIITEDATYWYHTFGASGAFIPKQSLTCDVLVVAGGASGGYSAPGGGGAGGLLAFTSQSLTAISYNVTVGGGGAASGTSAVNGNQGINSQFGSLTAAVGGGAGATTNNAGGTGGSGGGAGQNNATGGSATSGQGFAGGGYNGGGGGSGEAGANGYGEGVNGRTGKGGNGTTAYSSWGLATGTGENVSGTVYYAGGGGGYARVAGSPVVGIGGSGGGKGAGAGTGPGTANTGGGSGADSNAAGGSGVVIVRYAK
jgi:hypothetical protein